MSTRDRRDYFPIIQIQPLIGGIVRDSRITHSIGGTLHTSANQMPSYGNYPRPQLFPLEGVNCINSKEYHL